MKRIVPYILASILILMGVLGTNPSLLRTDIFSAQDVVEFAGIQTMDQVIAGETMTVQALLTGTQQQIQAVYVDFRAYGGFRVDLRFKETRELGTVFERSNIPVPSGMTPGSYMVPAYVISQGGRTMQATLDVTIGERLRSSAPEEETTLEEGEEAATTTEDTSAEETTTSEATQEETAPRVYGLASVVGKNKIQVYVQPPIHYLSINPDGSQFSLHRYDNYYDEVEIKRVDVNSTGEVLTFTSDALDTNTYYSIYFPDMPLKTWEGEDVQWLSPVNVEYRELTGRYFTIQSAEIVDARTVDVTFTRSMDMKSYYQPDAPCIVWSTAFEREVATSTAMAPRSPYTVRVTFDHALPVGNSEIQCDNMKGTFGSTPITRILKKPVYMPAKATGNLRERSDFNGDGRINEEDLAMLLEAMR